MYITLLPSSATGRSVTCNTVFWWILFQQPSEENQTESYRPSMNTKEAKLMPTINVSVVCIRYGLCIGQKKLLRIEAFNK